jgi:hypothetical protein
MSLLLTQQKAPRQFQSGSSGWLWRMALIDMVPGSPALLERLSYLGLLANETHTHR